MKKFVLVFLFLLVVFNINAQSNEHDIARQLVIKNSAAIGLSAEDLDNFIISSSYFNKTAGTQMVYLVQSYKSLPVNKQMLVLAFKAEKLVSKAGKFLQGLEQLVNVKTTGPSVSAANAVMSALRDRKLSAAAPAIINESKNNGTYHIFNNVGVSRENVTAKLMWVVVEKEVNTVNKVTKVNTVTGVRLAWEVYIIPKTTSDYWLVRIDAINGSTLGIDNLTDYDHWGHPAENTTVGNYPVFEMGTAAQNFKDNNNLDFKKITTFPLPSSPDLINGSTYTVIPFPAESPQHPGGAVATRTNPWTAAPGNATSLKWHTGTGGTDYNYTRGNNVWAYQDRTAPLNTGSVAKSATSTTALPDLTFNFTPNFTVDPLQTTPVQNQQFNITNLFYWSNIIHDLMYLYGFDEASANFQDNNQGRGGAGNDHVNAEAQDGSGTNNANFSTPADGSSGRMQMYLWTAPTPDRDGDVDNGIVVHEYGHGISNRLTGGGTGACLGNAEQMGEGWSDYYALMFTQDWATSTLTTGFTTPRGIGTYALNQPVTGTGIRSQKYCTNFSVNNKVYAATIPSAPHDRGEIWCATLWDMTWNIINQVGTINPNMFNVAAGGGNVIAMKLVTEGLKLQQCSPGFISGRNGILQADQNLYGGAYRCAILAAFARRGMGTFASEGSTGSVTDQVADFTGSDATLLLTQNGTVSVPEGQNIIYNNKISTGCSAISNYTLRDTLPANVTFVSATNSGSYNAGNRVVSWPVSLSANSTGNYGFTVNVNPGSYFPPTVLLNETVPSATISGSWTTASTTTNVWTAHNIRSKSAPNSFFTPDPAIVSDQTITTTAGFSLGATPPTLSFWHWYNTEGGYDGCVLEISTNGGTSWSDIGASNITKNGYNGIISNQYSNPIGGRNAWSGNSGAFIQSRVNLASYANQANVKFRWRLGADNGVGAVGWNVDDITLQNIAVVNMQSELFNGGIKLSISDTVTVITAGLPRITASAGANGSISDPGVSTVSIGGSKSYTITPDAGYAVADVLVDGISVGAVTGYTFTNVTTDHTIVASFILNSYTITATTGLNGTISPSGSTTVSAGGSQIYAISPDACYKIADVVVDGVSVGAAATYTFTNVTANHTISASFTLNTFTIMATSGANGTVTPVGASTVNCGANATYTITPAACYHVQDVLADGVSVGPVTTYTFTNVNANHTISASFTLNTFTVTATSGANGTITPAGASTVNCGANATYTITPAACYHVQDVLADGVSVGPVTTYTFTNVNANHTISASFTLNTFTVTATSGANGTITPAGASTVNCDANATYTITPAACYHVQDVLADGVSVGPVTTYTFTNVNANHTISASFTLNTFTVTATSGTNGTVTPVGASTVNCGANATYTITPAACYHVQDVLADGVSVGAVTTYTFTNVTSNHTISVSFALNAALTAPGPLNGPLNVCPYIGTGQQVTYSVPAQAGATYNWIVPPTVTMVSGQGTNSITVTIDNGFIQNTNKQLRVTALSSCGNSPQAVFLLVAQLPATPSPITAGSANVCAVIGTAGTITYSIARISSASSYIWAAQAGTTTITHPNGTGANDTTVTVSFTNGFTTSAITVQAVNSCGTSGTRSLTITRNNPAVGPITGPTNACPYMLPNGIAATYSVAPVSTAAFYDWTAPPGSTVTHPNGAGPNDYTITVQYPNGFTSGSITVSVSNGCGTSAVRTLAVSKLNAASPPPIDVIQTNTCPNRVYTYTISTMPANATSVQWTIPAAGTLVSGQGTTSITVSYPSTAINGTVTVQAINNCGASGIRSTTIKLAACPASFTGTSSDNGNGQSKTLFNMPEVADVLSVNVFPNPTISGFKLQVNTAGKEVINVRILDLQGRELKGINVMPYQTVNVGSDLTAGTYLIEVRQGKAIKATRVLKF